MPGIVLRLILCELLHTPGTLLFSHELIAKTLVRVVTKQVFKTLGWKNSSGKK